MSNDESNKKLKYFLDENQEEISRLRDLSNSPLEFIDSLIINILGKLDVSTYIAFINQLSDQYGGEKNLINELGGVCRQLFYLHKFSDDCIYLETDAEESAFYNSFGLNLVNFFGENIRDWAFSKSTLAEIRFSNNLKSIGDYSFYAMSNLYKVSVPGSVTHIGRLAFSGSSLYDVTLEEGVTDIGDDAFIDCGYLKSIEIPSTLKVNNHFRSFLSYIPRHNITFYIKDNPDVVRVIGECDNTRIGKWRIKYI